jgi:CHAT domain-containing protein/tetratricopeptide (TPR) repeat protein
VNRRDAVRQANDALHLANAAAGRAAPVVAAAVRRARSEHDDHAASIAERAWGRALLQCGAVDKAIRHLRHSIEHAGRAAMPDLAGEARIPLAAALVQRGRPRQALREIDTAVRDLNGAGHARARAQRADILHQIGRLEQAQAEHQVAIRLLRGAGDRLNLQRTLVNRGILHTERHSFAAAEADLLEADRLARALGRDLAVGIIAENLGYLETLRGDVPAALAHLSRAEQVIGAHGGQLGPVFLDRSELLLAVGAPAEAQQDAERAVLAFQRERRGLLIPGARLVLAQAAFMARDWSTALDQARRARLEFTRQQRTEWAELAQLVIVRTGLGQPGVRIRTSQLRHMLTTLTRSGWPAAALEAQLAASRLLIERGRLAEGHDLLAQAASTRRRGPAALRARGWYAEALARQGAGDRRGAASAARAGLRILDEHSTSLGATDLRVYSAVHRTELAELGLRAALRHGRVHQVFEWAERGRASRLLHQPVRPPDDQVLADLLTELRATIRDAGGPNTRLAHRRVALERQIRDRSRLHRGSAGGMLTAPVSVPILSTALGDQALIEFVQLDGTMFALSLVDGRLRKHELGPAAQLTDLIDRLPFALHRLARRDGGRQSRSAARALLADAASRLDALLLAPLPDLDGRTLAVVPTGTLHSLPWSVLPSCAGRAVTVSPSATLWHSASTRPRTASTEVAAVAGPGLTGARHEAVAVAEIHRSKAVVDDLATVDAVLALMRSAGVIHLAAHGRLATDNPLFSSLRLHDGPLVVYDLERQDRVPHTAVLASCDSSRSLVCTGDELLGLSATFIAKGAAQLVASVVPIPDAETAPLMMLFHRLLAAGRPAAAALAAAQRQLQDHDPGSIAAAAGFICMGGQVGPLTT